MNGSLSPWNIADNERDLWLQSLPYAPESIKNRVLQTLQPIFDDDVGQQAFLAFKAACERTLRQYEAEMIERFECEAMARNEDHNADFCLDF